MNGGGTVAEGPTRRVRTGTLVVLVLLAIGIGGMIFVYLWLARPGGEAIRNAGAAYRQLMEVGGVLQRYHRNHQRFPETLDALVQETDPVTRSPYLSEEMLVNPWSARLRIEQGATDRAIVRSRGPGVRLMLTVEKADRFSIEEEK